MAATSRAREAQPPPQCPNRRAAATDTYTNLHARPDAPTDAYTNLHARPDAPTDAYTNLHARPDAPSDTYTNLHARPDAPTDTYTNLHARPDAPTDAYTNLRARPDAPTDAYTNLHARPDAPTDTYTNLRARPDALTDALATPTDTLRITPVGVWRTAADGWAAQQTFQAAGGGVGAAREPRRRGAPVRCVSALRVCPHLGCSAWPAGSVPLRVGGAAGAGPGSNGKRGEAAVGAGSSRPRKCSTHATDTGWCTRCRRGSAWADTCRCWWVRPRRAAAGAGGGRRRREVQVT